MKTYQYTSPENTVVAVFDEDGISRMSMLASMVPGGVAILPYVAPPTTEAEIIAVYDAALGVHFDSVAAQRNYNSRNTAALRAGYPGPFQAEGLAFAQWMDNCNMQALQTLADVRAQTRIAPTIEEFIAELPSISWPASQFYPE